VLPVRSAAIDAQVVVVFVRDAMLYVVVALGVTARVKVPVPVPVTVPPLLLNTTDHASPAPTLATVPVIAVLKPLQIVVAALVIAAVGRGFTVTTVLPVKSVAWATQVVVLLVSVAIAYVVVAEGVTARVKVPGPMPVAVPPLLSNTTVQLLPAATLLTVPVMFVLAPLHIVEAALVIAAVGRTFTVTAVEPVMSVAIAAHVVVLLVREAIAYVVVAEGETAMLNAPGPVPDCVPPPLFKVIVQLFPARTFTVPEMLALPPLQIVVAALVIAAVGRGFTVMATAGEEVAKQPPALVTRTA